MIPQTSKPLHTPPGTPPKPTSGRENNHVVMWFIAVTLLILSIVLGFNLLGPEGASRSGVADGPARSSAGATTGGPSPGGATQQPRNGEPSPTAAWQTSPDARNVAVPQAPDSATPPGREGMGAPRGAAPPSPNQDRAAAEGQQREAVPRAATTPASATPAAPPASR